MKSIRFTMLSSLALALLGPCFGSGLAQAQGLTGKFTLPFEAHWGLATLQPGDYSFKLEHSPRGVLNLYQGKKTVAMIYALSSADRVGSRSVLVVVRDNESAAIREMVVPSQGMVLFYAVSKPKAGSAIGERRTAESIPIAITTEGE